MFKKLLAIACLVLWPAFLWLDYWWQLTVERAVREMQATYGEIYGPLSFFRPVTLYCALAATLVLALIVLLERARGVPPRDTDRR